MAISSNRCLRPFEALCHLKVQIGLMLSLVVSSICVNLLSRLEWDIFLLLLGIPHAQFRLRTRCVLRGRVSVTSSIRWWRGIVDHTVVRPTVASIVAGPVPPRKTVIVRIVEACTTSRGPVSSFLVPVIAEADDETDFEDENDHNDHYDRRIIIGGIVVIVTTR